MPSCPQCGAELDGDDPAGLCPKCLIQGAFDSSVSADDRTQTIDTATAAAEDDFGRYHILQRLGEGGMGTVYLAEQHEPIRRRVALKVVKLGMDTAQVLARFANERQALAIMDHPNIARIFDAGATPKGRPYFVMEYIEGVPVTQYCDRNRVTIDRRLELFVAVCRAVDHAHQKGVIHRDLKPSNVLVKEQDGAPLPKVIDFGIAKATDQWAVENSLLTQFGQMVGTPEYASPEQAEVMTGDIDQRSDVYSLGVLLYELLIGAVPFEGARMRQAGLLEMLRIMREEEAPPLSRKLTAMGRAANVVAESRRTDAASLSRLVEGDLNSITMKALEKMRERRYSSVSELAADIQRHLEHRPVLASPPKELRRAHKSPRNRAPALRDTSGEVKPPLAKVAIVLGDFANATGDPSFDGTLRQMMAVELGKSPCLTVLSDTRMQETLRLMRRDQDTKLTPDAALEIGERTGSAAVVEGSIARLGRQYVLGVHARNCRTGDILDQNQVSAAKKENVFKTLAEMANRFGIRAGESLPRLEKTTSMPTEVTTPSLEAWRSYDAATKAIQGKAAGVEGVSLLKRAIEIDPNFAMAYALMGRIYDGLGESELGAQSIAKAYELRDRVSDRENFFISFNYYRQAPRNLELARQTLESWIHRYPDDAIPHWFLSGLTSPGTGHHERAAEEGQKAIELDPDFSVAYHNAAFAYLYLNRLSEAESLLRKASDRKIEVSNVSICTYFIAFLKNDQEAMEREIAQRRTKLEAQGWFEHQEALTLAYQGRLQEANRVSDRAVSLARQGGLPERAAMFAGARAVWNALYGIRDQAQRDASAALSLFRGRDADYGPAFALALLDGSQEAQKIADELEKRYPEDTCVLFSYLPALRALEALNQGDAARAREITQAASPYDLAVPGTAYLAAFFGALYPVYVRGLAYSRLGRHRDAAAEFQKILDHPGIVLSDPIGPMARLQLARALVASGDRAKSATAYKDLLNIWKDADPDIPVVQEARAEPPAEARASPAKPPPATKVAIVLGDFANTTGEPAFDGTLRQMMAVELGKSPYLSVLSDTRMNETLRLMRRAQDAKLTPDAALEIGERTGSAAVVEGSIARLGRQYVVAVLARNCRAGDILHQDQESAAKKEGVLKALARMTERFGTRAGELLPTVKKEPSLPAEVTTSSLEAWRSYSAAMREFQAKAQSTETASLLKRAIEADPKFAMAYANLGRVHADLGDSELAAENVAKAYELRDSVSDRENYYVTFTYHRQLTRNLELCRQTLESWTRKSPEDLFPRGFLSGFTSPGTGRFERAVEEGLKAIEIDPNFAIGYENVAFAYVFLNRLSEAEALLQKASERNIEVVQFSLVRYFIAFLKDDQAGIKKEVIQRRAKLEAQGWFEHQEAQTLAYQGRLNEADRASSRAVSMARQAGLVGRVAIFEGARAVWNALFGNREEAQRIATVALSIFRSRDADYGPAFALALVGDSGQAGNTVADLEKQYPEDTSVQFSYLPALRALEALTQGDPAKAVEMTQAAAPYELAVPGTAYFTGASFFGALYPVYVRGLAYSRMGRHSEAAVEFQKILDHPGITLNDPIGPMARLQLARALSASGDRARSAAVYKDLLTIWRDADLENPVVRQARAEAATQP